jgi:transposase
MARFVGLDVSQKLTSICVVDDAGRRLWRGQCPSDPEQIERAVRAHAGGDASIGIETGPMTPWLVHELRKRGLNVVCLDARHASAALKMQMNKTDQNDAEGLAQIMRTGWYRSVHVKSLDAHRTRALLGARAQLVGMTTRLSNHIRGALKTFGMLLAQCAVFRSTDGSRLCSPIVMTWPRSSDPCLRRGDSCANKLRFSIRRCANWRRMTRRADF